MIKGLQRKPLTEQAYQVRGAQAVLQYGVGAMVDFPEQTLVTADGSFWSEVDKIYDERLSKTLKVDYFGFPKRIAYTRFPEWYFCPHCRKLQPLSKWIEDYERRPTKKSNDYNANLIYHPVCAKCNVNLVVARLVTVCEQGHLDDFPWVEWVHARNSVPICDAPQLRINPSPTGSEGLEGIFISCSCGAYTNLAGSLGINCFKELQKRCQEQNLGIFQKLCSGRHPQKLTYDHQCNCDIRAFPRGASAVYFPDTICSIAIPSYTGELNHQIEQSGVFERIAEDIAVFGEDYVSDDLDHYLKFTIRQIEAEETKELVDEIREILQKKISGEEEELDPSSPKYRLQEYRALVGEGLVTKSGTEEFVRKGTFIRQYLYHGRELPFVKSVSLITKVRVVKALLGFSRINPQAYNPKTNESQPCELGGFVSTRVQNGQTSWFPGVETKGEGIFIEIDGDAVNEWIKENPEVTNRVKIIQNHYDKSFTGKRFPRKITPKLVLLHTLSHMLIEQFSFDCGYNVASLSERLYCADKDPDGFDMSGIFIYTAGGDSEGTLGGLVRLGYPDRLPKNFIHAFDRASHCSNDPLCIMSKGQGLEALNLAACHACAFLPETCCEERNVFLDRGLLIGTFDKPDIGFWSKSRLKKKGLIG